MENVEELIISKKLIKRNETIGVAVSGGMDSMALLDCLYKLQDKLEFEIVAITVDHCLRDASASDVFFVMNYCKERGIRAYKFKVDVKKLALENNKSLETMAREARYGVFKSLIQKGIVDKVALAHHMEDQAETVLLHLLRGAGINGASAMDYISEDGDYIRPMLKTSKEEIKRYINFYDIPYVQDETNFESEFSRNYLRNEVMPLILKKWPNAVAALNNFAKICKEDNEYINSQVFEDSIFVENKKTVKIPVNYINTSPALSSRLIFKALQKIGAVKDIERKHIDLIRALAIGGHNSSKLKLPMGISALKEYDFLTITNEQKEKKTASWEFKSGSFVAEGYGKVVVKKVKECNFEGENLFIDAKNLPSGCEWRYRKDGDVITKFGGGTQKLKTYLSQKKIPLRLRDDIPVLAYLNEIYVVAGIGISEKVKVDGASNNIYCISVEK